MPLAMMKPGQTGRISRIVGRDETKKRLETLGFVVGEDITIVTELAGNLILNVKGSRVAINKTMANRIMM